MSEMLRGNSPLTTVLIEKEGRFYFYQPALGVIASGESVEGAYEKFIGTRHKTLEDVERAGIGITWLSPPAQAAPPTRVAASPGVVRELGMFLAKAGLVLLLIGAMGTLGAIEAKRSVDRLVTTVAGGASGLAEQVKALTTISMVDVANKAAMIVQDVQSMPEERKESLRRSIGLLSHEAAPIVDAWRNPLQKTAP